jgi:hypothetical protein
MKIDAPQRDLPTDEAVTAEGISERVKKPLYSVSGFIQNVDTHWSNHLADQCRRT